MKTGAARIALGAAAAGVPGIEVQPVGIHYEDKAAFRSRVLVAFGAPLDLDRFAAGLPDGGRGGAVDRGPVELLNAQIDASLRQAGPDFDDWAEAADLQLAAEVTIRSVGATSDDGVDVPPALREPLAGTLARLPHAVLADPREAARAYRTSLDAVRSTDAILSAPGSRPRLVAQLALDVLLAVLLLPYALVGAVLGLLPYLLTQATRLIPAAPAMRATILPLVALVVFLTEWVGLAVWSASRGGWQTGLLIALLVPAFLVATVIVAERAVQAWRGIRRWWTSGRTGGPLEMARRNRDALIRSVTEALREVGP